MGLAALPLVGLGASRLVGARAVALAGDEGFLEQQRNFLASSSPSAFLASVLAMIRKSGSVRAAMAAGHRIATHRRNLAFVRQIATAPKTVRPDALSRGRAAPPVVAVGDSLVVGTGERRVVLYEMPTAHCEGMLAAFVPGAGILFASDVLSPPAAGASTPLAPAGSAEVVAFARMRGIAVSRFAGGHGGVAAWADLERAAARP